MPGRDSEGLQTWNPSVGLHFKPAAKKRESYGGIIGALQDLQSGSGNKVKSYPENFAGIIAAIQDLILSGKTTGSDTGVKPPGGDIIINPDTGVPDWIITEEPLNGQLWFDTRQGRLMVWETDDWYQTNGADGLPIVTDDGMAPGVEYVVPGQFWYDAQNNNLYIYAGESHTDGTPVWRLIADLDQDFIQTTATLPLAAIGPRVTSLEDYAYLPDPDISEGNMLVQKDFNEWVFQSLVNLDVGLETLRPVLISDTPPPSDDPDKPLIAGQLWYDTETLELSIWYEDDNSSQWVPTSVSYAIDEQLLPLEAALATETRLREQAIHNLYEMLENFDVTDNAEIAHLGNLITALEAKVDRKPVVDMTGYVTSDDYSTATSQLISRLVSLETATPDYSSLVSNTELEEQHAYIGSVIASKATPADVAAVAAQIPDVSNFLVQQDVVDAIANITTEYLPRTGGVLTGSFQLQKNDYALPSLDFSGASWYSKCAFQFTANAPTPANTKFGTTENPWEYAWEFGADEDFCWIYNDTNKVFSITKEGPACSTLYLGDIGDNTNNGRVIHNKIDVKERLHTYQSAFESIRQAVSSSTDYDSLKSGLLTALANV